MVTPIIKTQDLTKVYGRGDARTVALNNLSMTVPAGEIFGYLGPNGAGKTTTIRLLLDIIRPTAGRASIFGLDVGAHSIDIHRRVGFLPGELNLWKNYTARQALTYVARIRGDEAAQMKEAQHLAERFKFDMTKKVRDFSTGNKRKLGLILALMHKPDLLILDEPTSGLDPLMQQAFNALMREARDAGRTVFLSSHVLSEVQAICDRVGILRNGELKAVESVDHLTHFEFRYVDVTLDAPPAPSLVDRLASVAGVGQVSAEGRKLKVQLFGDFDPLLRALSDVYVADMDTIAPALEEIFLAYYEDDAQPQAEASVKEMA